MNSGLEDARRHRRESKFSRNFCKLLIVEMEWNEMTKNGNHSCRSIVLHEFYHQSVASCWQTLNIFSITDSIFVQIVFIWLLQTGISRTSLCVQTITNHSQNHHLSSHTLHKQVKQKLAKRQSEKTLKSFWKSFRKTGMWRDNLRSAVAIMLRRFN